jgi:transposase-like protein
VGWVAEEHNEWATRSLKWRHFEAEIIVCAIRWYLRYSLSYREVQKTGRIARHQR